MREGDQKNITYCRQRYRSSERELEITPYTKDKGKATVGEEEMTEPKSKEEMAFNDLLWALSDLAKGLKDMLEEVKSQKIERTTLEGFYVGKLTGPLSDLITPHQ